MTQALGMALDAATLVLLTSYGLSVLVAADAHLRRRAASARASWWRVVAPPVGGLLLVLLGFGSALWDAWMVTPDHCGGSAAHQPYLCWPHPAGAAAASATEVLAVGLLALALGATAVRLGQWLVASRRIGALVAMGDPADATAFRAILARGGGSWQGPITVVRTDEPLCGVTGVLAPRLLVSTAIAARLKPADLAVIVAHERAHVRRRDLPRRLMAHLLRAAHVPGLGKRAVDAWALAAEMACDQAAARACGSPVLVAEALVRYRRAFPTRNTARTAVAAFAGPGELEARVRRLLDPPASAAASKRAPWLLAVGLLGAGMLVPGVHTGLETLLRLLHA